MQIVKNFCDVCGLEISIALGNYPATLNIKNPNGKSFFDAGFRHTQGTRLEICHHCMHSVLNYLKEAHTYEKTMVKP
jgi:hypothetical protein